MASPLLDREIQDFAIRGGIEPFAQDQVNPASYNLRIGNTAKIEQPFHMADEYETTWRKPLYQDIDLTDYTAEDPFWLPPGGWILTDVLETIRIPADHEAQVILRSSAARRGWDHALAGYVDPGYEGKLTLEFVNCLNYSPLPIYPGLRLVQLRICKLSAAPDRHYGMTGRYQNADRVEGCKDGNL